MPLGASNDDSVAVQIEIRAAELAVTVDWYDHPRNGYESLGLASPDGEHVDMMERDIADGRDRRADLQAYLAGHLALIIYMHDADTTP